MECALHVTTIALTGMRGFSQRSLRILKIAENHNLHRLELLKSESDIKSLVEHETEILQRNQEEILEDARNMLQVSMFTQSEMRYWYDRILKIWLDSSKLG